MIDNKINAPLPPTGGKERLEWVDTAKALGLILVFWGHLLYGGSSVAGVINRAIYSFHMPMYFILSGYVIKQDSTPFFVYFKNKFARILLPALLLYSLTLPIYFYYLDYSSVSFVSVITDIFYIKGQCAYNWPIWFFFCLFQVLIIVKAFKMTEISSGKLMFVLVIALVASYLCYVSECKWLCILGLDKCLLSLFFFVCGMMLKRVRYDRLWKTIGFVSLPVWLITGVWLNTKVSMYLMHLGSFGLFVISGLAGSLFFFAFCRYFEKINFIRQYSKWTIFIVCSHYVLVTLFFIISSRLSITGTYTFDLISAIFMLLTLYMYKPICEYLNSFFPILLGNKKNYAKNL